MLMNYTIMLHRPATRLLFLVFVLCGSVAGLQSQAMLPQAMQRSVRPGKPGLNPKAVCTNDAGTIAGLVNITAQSNSFSGAATQAFAPNSPDTLFLCRGDEFTIDFQEGSEDLSGDPDPATQPGIGFALHRAVPTVSGVSFADISADPGNPSDGLPPLDAGKVQVLVPFDYSAGDYSLRVENVDAPFLQEYYPLPDGTPGPVVFYFSPITVDAVEYNANGDGVAQVESIDTTNGGGVPECINVSIDQYVAVGLLNPIAIANATQSTTDCSGSFVLRGGISELRGTTDYSSIEIRETTTGQVAALDRPAGTYRTGDVVNYTVPGPGNYAVTISDNIACDFSGSVSHSVAACASPPASAITLTVDKTDVTCLGSSNGRITASASGGTPEYSFTYTRTSPATPPVSNAGSPTTTTVDGAETVYTGLPGGVYTVTVTDANGETTTQNVEVVEPNITVDITVVQQISCFDDTNGNLVAQIFDGADSIPNYADYTFLWSTGATTRQISGLGPDNYSVTATNNVTGCRTTASLNLRAPNRLLINQSQLNTDPATCSGVSDGTVDIPVTGGTRDTNGEYTLNWSDGIDTTGTSVNRTDLLPGSYSVTVTDANGCSDSVSLVIAAEKTLVLAADSANITCFGEGDGSITVTGSFTGATPNYPLQAQLLDNTGAEVRAYQDIPNQGSTPITFQNLGPGNYTVVLRDQDSQGCETTANITVVEPALLQIDTVTTTDFGCPDEFGTATPVVSGGTAPYSFRFKNDSLPDPVDTLMTFDSLVVDTNFIGDLQPDTNYVVIVEDANGCIDSTTFKIFSPPRAAIAPIAVDSVSCPDSQDGQLFTTVTAPQGETVTETTWYRLNPDGTIGDEVAIGTRTEANLAVGFYLFEAKISNECVSQAIGEVASPGLVALDSFLLQPPVCLGDANGSIFVYPTGGTPPYRYDWSVEGASTTSNAITNLASGTYSVTITDANNCRPVFDTTFVLEEPVGITGTFSNLQPVSCPDSTTADGSATFDARFTDDSTGLFDFYWSTGDTILQQSTSTISNLTRGPISVTVTDGICPQVFIDTIGSPEDFVVSFTTEDVSCNGQNDGTLTATVSGGTPPYSYQWVGRTETGPTLDSLSAGTYQLVITDSRGCTPPDTTSATILEPDALVLSINETLTTPTVTCAGDSNGVLAVFVSSTNNNPLTESPYRWSSNVDDRDDNVANNLVPDTYSVTVTDVRGCQDSLQYTIVDPQPIVFSVDPIQPPLCYGEMTPVTIDTAFGGQGTAFTDFTYTLNNDGFLMPVDQPGSTFAGDVVVSVFDPVGCRADQTITVDQPEEINIELADRIIVDLGDSLVQLDPIVTPPDNYSYLWTPADFLSSDSIRNPYLFALQNRDYTLTVTSPNGCTAEEDIFVEVDANRNVYLPNAFSPNRDGRNEDFRIYACQGVVKVTKVQIFNRWGGLVHEATEIPANCLDGTLLWDGTTPNGSAEGRPVGMGVYVYVVEVAFLDNVLLTYRGDISVIR